MSHLITFFITSRNTLAHGRFTSNTIPLHGTLQANCYAPLRNQYLRFQHHSFSAPTLRSCARPCRGVLNLPTPFQNSTADAHLSLPTPFLLRVRFAPAYKPPTRGSLEASNTLPSSRPFRFRHRRGLFFQHHSFFASVSLGTPTGSIYRCRGPFQHHSFFASVSLYL